MRFFVAARQMVEKIPLMCYTLIRNNTSERCAI